MAGASSPHLSAVLCAAVSLPLSKHTASACLLCTVCIRDLVLRLLARRLVTTEVVAQHVINTDAHRLLCGVMCCCETAVAVFAHCARLACLCSYCLPVGSVRRLPCRRRLLVVCFEAPLSLLHAPHVGTHAVWGMFCCYFAGLATSGQQFLGLPPLVSPLLCYCP